MHHAQAAWDVVLVRVHLWMCFTWLQQLEWVLDAVGMRSERAGKAETHVECQPFGQALLLAGALDMYAESVRVEGHSWMFLTPSASCYTSGSSS